MTVTNAISDATEGNILKLIYNATAWANVAQNNGTSPLTSISNALHTADPGEANTQNQSEISTTQYAGYARVDVARTTGGWTVTANSVSPVATIAFAASTGGSTGGTITHWSTGKTGGGATEYFWRGDVTPNIVITAGGGVTPQLTTGSTITLD